MNRHTLTTLAGSTSLLFVSCLIATGFAPRSNTSDDQPAYYHPRIAEHGKVVQLPDAAHQPRNNSLLCVDLVQGGEPDQINRGLEKVARFVNIYAGAGAKPAECKIVVVLHGKATPVALNHQAFKAQFDVEENPSLELLNQLRDAGVSFVVCGQAMRGSNYPLDQTAEGVDVSVSALTAIVNLQSEGYALVPLY